MRYRARDVVRILGTGPCACGRSTFRFRVLGRSDDMLHVRGVNVFPGGVGNVLAHLTDRFSGEFQIRRRSPSPAPVPAYSRRTDPGLLPEQAGDLAPQAVHRCASNSVSGRKSSWCPTERCRAPSRKPAASSNLWLKVKKERSTMTNEAPVLYTVSQQGRPRDHEPAGGHERHEPEYDYGTAQRPWNAPRTIPRPR